MIEIPFYESSHFVFSNFSAHRVEYVGEIFSTVEHAFHAQKFDDGEIRRQIVNAGSPLVAWQLSRQYKSQRRPDWDEVKVGILTELIRAKAAQHQEVRDALLATGDELIAELNPDDAFWGTGADGTGQNHTGKILMRVREELRS